MEWSEKKPRITKNSTTRLGYGWIFSMCLEEFVCKMMKFLKAMVKARNGYGR